MFYPPHWNHNNIRFPDNEIDEVISKIKKVITKQGDNYSTYHKDSEHPESQWLSRYREILERVLTNIGLHENAAYEFTFWAQLYTTDCSHGSHHHFDNEIDISFVHFLRVPSEPLFRFVNNKGDFYIPRQGEGDILFFPSWLWHQVVPHKSDKERFVVAGNINIQDMNTRPFIPPGTHDS